MQVTRWDTCVAFRPESAPAMSILYIIAEISIIRVELRLGSGSLAQIGQDESDKCVPAIIHLLSGTSDLSQPESKDPPNTYFQASCLCNYYVPILSLQSPAIPRRIGRLPFSEAITIPVT